MMGVLLKIYVQPVLIAVIGFMCKNYGCIFLSVPKWLLSLFFMFFFATKLFSQVVPSYENEQIQFTGLGPVAQESSMKWFLEYKLKAKNIEKIEIYNVSHKKPAPIFILQKEDIYSNSTHISKAMKNSSFDWLYESKQTNLLFLVNIVTEKTTDKLYVPLSFSEKSKISLRKIMKSQFKYSKKPVEVTPYHFIDGRKWQLGNQSKDDSMVLYEYTLEGEKIASWKELYSVMVVNNEVNLNKFIKIMKSSLSENCSQLEFQHKKLNKNAIFYEWKDNGCNGLPEHEMAVVFNSGGKAIRKSYAHKSTVMPSTNYSVWKTLLLE